MRDEFARLNIVVISACILVAGLISSLSYFGYHLSLNVASIPRSIG